MHRLSLLLSVILSASVRLYAQLNVYYVDVGQGDATYLEFPNGSNALIDGGPSGAKISKFLQDKGVTKIDHVVLTHPHGDHYVGLKNVFSLVDVKNFYDTKMENTGATGDNDVRMVAKAKSGCKTHFPETGEKMKWDPKVDITVLNSCAQPVQSAKNFEINNCSIVLKVVYNGSSLLFMGDAEERVEDVIMAQFKTKLESYALKVSHHGSRYASSKEFLDLVKPKVAIISVGLNNNFAHPHKEALDRLREVGAKIFLTTSGTQTLNIPAPKKGIAPVLDGPTLYTTGETLPPAFESIIYTPEILFPPSAGSGVLEQLKAAAAEVNN